MVSEDTDVIALLLSISDLLNGQLFKKFLDVKRFRSGLSSNISGLRLIKRDLDCLKKVNNFRCFQTLGESLIVPKEVNEKFKEIVCQIYGSKHRSIYDLHYHLFYAKKVEIEPHLLPRSKVSFHEHNPSI